MVGPQEPVINPNEPSDAQDSTKEAPNPMDPGDFRTPQNTQDPLPQNIPIPPEGSVPIDSAEVTDQGVFDPFLNPSGPGAPPIPLFDPFKDDPSQFDPNGPQGGPPGQPFNPNAPGGPGGPADPFANLQPVAASALGAGGNPSLQPVAASALGAGGNPPLQPAAASSLGASGSPSGVEAAPENCPPPVTCDKGQISCPTEAPKPGSICLPPLKCIDRRETCFFNPDRPFDSNAPEGLGGPADPFASLQPVPASTLGAGGNPSLKPVPASTLGAGGNPSLKPVAASTLGAGGNPSLQPVAASIQGDPSKPIAASSSGDSGLLSGPEAAPETCPPPVTCGPGQITCPTSFPKPGSTCPPPLKCIEMNEKGPNGQFCPGYCPTICTEESQSCPGNVGRDGCNRPGICISKEGKQA